MGNRVNYLILVQYLQGQAVKGEYLCIRRKQYFLKG